MSVGSLRVPSRFMLASTSLAMLLIAVSAGPTSATAAPTSSGIDTTGTANSLPLAVQGTAVLTLNLDLSSVFAGSVTAPSYQYQSDARLKTDIRPIPHALDRLLTIKGVEFSWKQDGRPDVGVVAQNVAESFPQLVHKDKQGMLSVEYGNLVGPMIESIRELKAENDEMKSEIKLIRAELEKDKQTQGQTQRIGAQTSAFTPAQSLKH